MLEPPAQVDRRAYSTSTSGEPATPPCGPACPGSRPGTCRRDARAGGERRPRRRGARFRLHCVAKSRKSSADNSVSATPSYLDPSGATDCCQRSSATVTSCWARQSAGPHRRDGLHGCRRRIPASEHRRRFRAAAESASHMNLQCVAVERSDGSPPVRLNLRVAGRLRLALGGHQSD